MKRLVVLASMALAVPAGATTPPGGEIVFEHGGRLVAVASEGAEDRVLPIAADASWPAWSPDGRRLAFASVRRGGIFVVNADGGGLRRVTRSPTLDLQPAWSPDGRRVAFARLVPGWREEIFVAGLDGRGARRLTSNRGQDLEPDWAPNGRRIAWAFTSTQSRRAHPATHTMSPDGARKRRVGPGASPDWSPDGRRFALAIAGEIFTSEVTGRGRVEVTFSPAADTRPEWSPDGARIAFLSTAGSPRERPRVFTVLAGGGGETLVSAREPAGAPSWRR